MEQTNSAFVQHIVNEYDKRRVVNPSYSLRAFSRDIGVDQSLMTKILKGKRRVSADLVSKLSVTFNLTQSAALQEAIIH